MTVRTTATATVERVQRKKFAVSLLLVQIAMVILFAFFARYADERGVQEVRGRNRQPALGHLGNGYPAFQDVHLLVFVGFGLLVAFLKRYAYSGIGYNFLIAAFVLQWGIFVHEMILTRGRGILMGLESLLTGDFAAATVIVTFGAVLGKMNPFQLLVMALLEVVAYSVNRYIGVHLFQAADSGYSMYAHLFGAYFGIAVSRMLNQQHHHDHPQESRTYYSDVFSMLGTLFLWVCFPSFNAAMAPASLQQRAIVNSVFSLAGCTITTFVMMTFLSKEEKFNPIYLQNSALAGGVAIGSAAHLFVKPYGALLVGMVAAALSVLGYTHIGPCIRRKMRIHDSRGVHNVHGLPGLLAGVVSIIVAAMATPDTYGMDLYRAFPAMAPTNQTTDTNFIQMVRVGQLNYGEGRTAGVQAGLQAATMFVSLGIALVCGAVTGLIMRLRCWEAPNGEAAFDDKDYWTCNEEGMPMYTVYVPPPAEKKEEEGTAEEAVELKPTAEEKAEETA